MLTVPVNVIATTSHGASLKTHASGEDASSGKNPPAHPPNVPVPPVQAAEPEPLPGAALALVNAVAATAASRTVLQTLAMHLASLLDLVRGKDESLTDFFTRIISAIERMPQSERLQLEVRSGLKALKITLSELATALKKPDGAEAARVTAMIEAPAAAPGKTSANAATSSYLQQGTADGHAEETLAMRAAARSNAAGLGLFSPESKARPTDHLPADPKNLQNQLKTLFEPDASDRRTSGEAPTPTARDAAPTVLRSEGKSPVAAAPVVHAGGTAVEVADTDVAPADPEQRPEIAKAAVKEEPKTQAPAAQAPKADGRLAERSDTADHPAKTLPTLKGLAEAVTSLPGKAAELFAAPPAAAEVADEAVIAKGTPVVDDGQLAEPATTPSAARLKAQIDMPAPREDAVKVPLPQREAIAEKPATTTQQALPPAAMADDDIATEAARRKPAADMPQAGGPVADNSSAAPRPALAHEGVPFAYAVLQPAKDEFSPEIEEGDESRDDGRDDSPEDDASEDEARRPRDAYDEMKDHQPEEEPAIVITRDSSEADRAFALYQRMGGF